MKPESKGIFCLVLGFVLFQTTALASMTLPRRQGVLDQARYMLEHWNLSYVFGGGKLGDPSECELCNRCLEAEKPDKSRRLTACPSCRSCSLDCSHFTHEVFRKAGLKSTYLTTSMMRDLGPSTLLDSFQLVDIGTRVQRALPGDLLVYPGHVVMLEKRLKDGLGDVIHVTSGRDLSGPGLGIQRERHVFLNGFRGPLQRILRHAGLVEELQAVYLQSRRQETQKNE